MSSSSLSSETLHASCVAKDGRAILISGRSGSASNLSTVCRIHFAQS